MKFKLDENLPESLVDLLAAAGHDALSVTTQELGGERDEKIAVVCTSEDRALVTLDTGFADIRAYPPKEHAGIIVLRIGRQDVSHIKATVTRVLSVINDHPLRQTLWVVEDHRIRFRH